MARTKRGKLSAKQDEVMKLLDAGQTIPDIASLMDTTPNAIKAQISRMRAKGHTISTVNGRTTEPSRAEETAPVRGSVSAGSVESHIESEVERVSNRLVTVEASLTDLTKEEHELTERRDRLEAARSSLGGTNPRPALAAVA